MLFISDMKALLIIDIQNDFLPGGRLAVPQGNTIIPGINTIQPYFDIVIATQDWHPENHKSFAKNHSAKKEFATTDLKGIPQILWPEHCVQGSYGAQLADALHTRAVSAIIRKGMNPEIDSYSGFYDNGKQNATGLLGLLKELQVEEVYVCGLAADYCVYYTAKDAVQNGFNTFFIEDITKAIDQNSYQTAKKDLLQLGVVFTETVYLKK